MITGLERFEAAIRDYLTESAQDSERHSDEARAHPVDSAKLADEVERYLGAPHPAVEAMRQAPSDETERAVYLEALYPAISGRQDDEGYQLSRAFGRLSEARDTRTWEELLAAWEAEVMPPELERVEAAARCAHSLVEAARGRVEGWSSGEPEVRIRVDEREYERPGFSTDVHLGGASFMLGIAPAPCAVQYVDDVMDAGDQDFFTDPQLQKDYFDLVSELKEAGKTSRPGKKLRLFTARPVADRAAYQDASRIPGNIFLADSPDHVEGLAHDLGSGEVRDIWEIVVYSKYVSPTLETPELKYYQVTDPAGAPIESAWLVAEGKKP